MKRIIAVLSILLAFYMPVFAQTEESEPDNGNVQTEEENIEQNEDSDDENIVRKENDYKVNGRGDQFIKIGLMPNFPMNFGDKLYVGGAAQLGYYHFFTSWFAIGGELMAGYNPTLGSNVLTFVPVTTGVMFQPSFRRFEFPVFGSYQHATKAITLNESRNYNFHINGYGNVFQFGSVGLDAYDGMAGVDIAV